MEEFYNDNKHTFKANDDKILSFEDAKKNVKAKLQLKKAKKEAEDAKKLEITKKLLL